jgi:hypothetical protein
MKKYILLLALVAGLGGGRRAQAQVSKFNIGLGLGLVPLRSTAPDQANPDGYYGTEPGYVLKTLNADLLLISANLGFDAPLWQFKGGEQALGVSLNAALGAFKSAREELDGFNGSVLGDFPEYLTYRYGAKASKHAKSSFGVGAGLGYRFCTFTLPFSSPSAMLEGAYSSSDRDWFLRLSADLRPTRFYDNFSSEGLVEVLRIQQFNLLLGRTF